MGALSHGFCAFSGCKCRKFTWARDPISSIDVRALVAERVALRAALQDLIDAHRRVVHGDAVHVPAALLNAAEAILGRIP